MAAAAGRCDADVLARLAALSLAIVISALLVNAVGIIGFIGLFAPLLAKMLGARRLLPRLMLASLIGALILWLSDQIILWLTRVWMEVSTGSVTALIGAPLLLWLLPRLRSISAPDMKVNDRVAAERQHVLAFALAGGVLLLMAVVVALSFGRDAHGWTWASAVCGRHAGGGGLYYSATDRKPDGKPGSAGD